MLALDSVRLNAVPMGLAEFQFHGGMKRATLTCSGASVQAQHSKSWQAPSPAASELVWGVRGRPSKCWPLSLEDIILRRPVGSSSATASNSAPLKLASDGPTRVVSERVTFPVTD